MILFLNVNSNMIELYSEEGVVRIPFRDAGQLYNYVEENSNLLYITNAVQTTPTEVINMIKGMGVAIQEDIPVETGIKYLYSPSKGTIYINEFLKFEEIKRKKIMMGYKSHQQVLLDKQKKIDEGLDSIIVSTSVESALENGIVDTNHESAEEINILGAGPVSDSGGMATMSELMNEIEGF
jgi:hypothetical protein